MSDEFIFVTPSPKGAPPSAAPSTVPNKPTAAPSTVQLTPDAASDSGEFIFVSPTAQEKKKKEFSPEAAGIGAMAGATYKAKQMASQEGSPRGTSYFTPDANLDAKGLQAYLNSQINQKYNLPLGELERIVGTKINTPAQVQAAVKFIQGSEAQRVPNVVTNSAGQKRVIGYKQIPGQPAYDLSPYEKTLLSRAKDVGRAAIPAAGEVSRGALAGAVMAPMAYQMLTQKEPTDWTQWMSLFGSGLGMTRSGPLGLVGTAMQAPYIVKHANEIAGGLGFGEINPTAFGGAPEALETPIRPLPVGQ
jgi:hypothetical protein